VAATLPGGSNSRGLGEGFYGWRIVATAVFTFGIAVGVPYYNIPFFYDYFQKTHHWRLEQITLGFPLAAALSIWIGPLLVPRIGPRKLIIGGTGLTALSLFSFSAMNSSLSVYYLLCFVYMVGFILCTKSSFRIGSRRSVGERWGSCTQVPVYSAALVHSLCER
jgi:MFS family permease